MKIWNKLIVCIASLGGAIAGGIKVFGLEEFKNEIIIGILIVSTADSIISTIQKFRRFTLLQTRYDIVFRIFNLTIGFIAIVFFIENMNYFFNFGWILLLIGLLGLFKGLFYQNSIQLRKKSSQLIIKYKNRSEKIIDELDSVIYSIDKIVLVEKDRVIEINDLKNTKNNINKTIIFFEKYNPDVALIQK